MNTKTKAQRINKRHDAIWDKAKAFATSNAQDERILNASAKAIGPCHLPSKREMADKSAHTPAVHASLPPWEVCDHQVLSKELNDYGNFNVCSVQRLTELTHQDKLNLRLIAAAPDLLRICKQMLEEYGVLTDNEEAYSRKDWEAVIAKAEGSAQ